MNKLIVALLAIIIAIGSIFATDCNEIKNKIKNEKAIRILSVSLFFPSAILFAFYGGTDFYPAPDHRPTQRQEDIRLGMRIGTSIAIPIELIFFFRSGKRISRLNDTLELNCKLNN
jgi:hypothetical protein